MKKTRRWKKQVLYVILILFLIPFIISSINIYKWYKDHNKYEKIVEEIEQHINIDEKTAIPKLTIDFDELEKINAETVAYLYVKNTKINYPVVKTKDNDYYLDHAFNKTKNQSGWIFMDYRNNLDENDKNIIIYGHNTLDGTMFGTLRNVVKKEWYENEDNHIIKLELENETLTYQVFSTYSIKVEDYYINTIFKDNNEFNTFINTLKKRSVYNYGVDVSGEDSILTLSTCTGNGKSRMVLHAKRLDLVA